MLPRLVPEHAIAAGSTFSQFHLQRISCQAMYVLLDSARARSVCGVHCPDASRSQVKSVLDEGAERLPLASILFCSFDGPQAQARGLKPTTSGSVSLICKLMM